MNPASHSLHSRIPLASLEEYFIFRPKLLTLAESQFASHSLRLWNTLFRSKQLVIAGSLVAGYLSSDGDVKDDK